MDTLNQLTAPDYQFRDSLLNDLVFIDFDNDGDMDAFFVSRDTSSSNPSVVKYSYIQNNGTSSTPNFNNILSTPFGGRDFRSRLNFYDWDNDGDVDATMWGFYYENTGSTANSINFIIPNFSSYPFNSSVIFDTRSLTRYVDIDGDGDMDIYGYSSFGLYYPTITDTTIYYENRTIVLDLPKLEEQKLSINFFPNPTTGIIQLEKPLTGTLEVFNTLGQVLYTTAIEEQQQIDLGNLAAGNYIIKIHTAAGILNEKIVLRK